MVRATGLSRLLRPLVHPRTWTLTRKAGHLERHQPDGALAWDILVGEYSAGLSTSKAWRCGHARRLDAIPDRDGTGS